MLASGLPPFRLVSRWRMHLRRAVVLATSLVVTAPLLAVPVWAAPADGADPAAPPVKPVPGRPLPKASDPQIPPETKLPAATWPAPGAAVVDIPATAAPSSAFTRGKVPGGTVAPGKEPERVRAGTLPVFVGRPAAPANFGPADEDEPGAADVPAKVRVEVLPRQKAVDLNVSGVLFRVDRADGQAGSGAAEVVFDYSSFRAAYGAGYGRRLRIVRYPACFLTTPDVSGLCTRNRARDTQRHGEQAARGRP